MLAVRVIESDCVAAGTARLRQRCRQRIRDEVARFLEGGCQGGRHWFACSVAQLYPLALREDADVEGCDHAGIIGGRESPFWVLQA